MNEQICKQISSNTLIYVSPCKPLTLDIEKEGIFTHRISHECFLSIVDDFTKLNKETDGTIHKLVDTIYRYNDQIMMVDNKGNHKCMMKPIKSTFYDPKLDLRMVKYFPIELSITRFKPSLEYNHRRQMLCVVFSTGEYDMQVEVLFKDIQKHRDVNAEYKRIVEDPDYPLSISYKFYIHDINCIETVIPLLSNRS